MNFLNFFYFRGSFLPSWIRIRNTGRNVYPAAAKEHLEQRIPLSFGTLEMRTILGEAEVDDPWKCECLLLSRGGDLGT
jgi:hypothetical protein